MKVVHGNLIDLSSDFDVIVHGCNCFHTFGAGFAKQVKERWPEAYAADLATKKGDVYKLGTYSSCVVGSLTIVNAYTQYDWGIGVRVEYQALREIFKRIKKDFPGKRIAYPAIGAGLAGGDWNTIARIINEELAGEDHTFVKFKP